MGESLHFSPRLSFEIEGKHRLGLFYTKPHIYLIDGPFASGDISPFRDQRIDWRAETGRRFSIFYKYQPKVSHNFQIVLYVYLDDIDNMHSYGKMLHAKMQGILLSVILQKGDMKHAIHFNINSSTIAGQPTSYDQPFALKHQMIFPIKFISPKWQLTIAHVVRAGKLYNRQIYNSEENNNTKLSIKRVRLPNNYELSLMISRSFCIRSKLCRLGVGIENPHILHGLFPKIVKGNHIPQ